jgi:hypothetical protein
VTIYIHIERLILDGVPLPAVERPLLQSVVERELARRLTASNPWAGVFAGGAVTRLTAPMIHLPAQPDASAVGRQIGGAIHTGLTQ